jgi:hypothetical protein
MANPILIKHNVREQTIYTPINYEEKAGTTFELKAPSEIRVENKSLTFVRWDTPEGAKQNNLISLTLNMSSPVTALYQLNKAE